MVRTRSARASAETVTGVAQRSLTEAGREMGAWCIYGRGWVGLGVS